ncbi:MAG: hypothetical protein SF069_07100 [Phycisphaerae bacterium]|nr:hypothetical protein [Phycisphaerae bacterium]
MRRSERRLHLLAWLILAPLIVYGLAAARGIRPDPTAAASKNPDAGASTKFGAGPNGGAP